MTAFARKESQQDWGSLVWEIRSVNHRYLEPHFRLPETLRDLEIPVREILRKHLQRGKIECNLRFKSATQQSNAININEQVATQLNTSLERMAQLIPNAKPANLMQALQWPGLLQEPEQNLDPIKTEARNLFNAAIEDLIAHRQREGAELGEFIQLRLDKVEQQVNLVKNELPGILAAQKENLSSRLGELKQELDPQRLEQEMVILAQKADVDEELDRLTAHIKEVQRTLKQKGAIGRRLDFLMQEFNREANTLSSKSISTITTQSAVELKVLIEQMREQVQNIE